MNRMPVSVSVRDPVSMGRAQSNLFEHRHLMQGEIVIRLLGPVAELQMRRLLLECPQ